MIARHRTPSRSCALIALGSLALPALCAAQAPPSPEHPWAIPEGAIERATALASQEKSAPTGRPYDLAVRNQVVGLHRYRIAIPKVVNLVSQSVGADIQLAVAQAVELIEWIGSIHLNRQLW